ncbi:hypothetical protein GCM10018954_008900 [Kutzneria kofuensis]
MVRGSRLRAQAVLGVVGEAAELGLRLHGVVASPLPGPSGNVEYFVWFAARRAAAGRAGRGAGRHRGPGGAEMTQLNVNGDREILLVVKTGRQTNLRLAEKVAGRFAEAGIRLRVVEDEAADLDRSCYARWRRPAPRPSAPSWCSPSAATARCCGPPSWPVRSARRCWASTWAGSASWSRPRWTTWTRPCSG